MGSVRGEVRWLLVSIYATDDSVLVLPPRLDYIQEQVHSSSTDWLSTWQGYRTILLGVEEEWLQTTKQDWIRK